MTHLEQTLINRPYGTRRGFFLFSRHFVPGNVPPFFVLRECLPFEFLDRTWRRFLTIFARRKPSVLLERQSPL